MDQILEKWDEILMTVKTEHDISDIAFNTFLRPLEFYGVTGNTASPNVITYYLNEQSAISGGSRPCIVINLAYQGREYYY